jgi:hypothetical protein
MASYTFEAPHDANPSFDNDPDRTYRKLRERMERILEEQRKAEEEEARRAAQPASTIITLRIPTRVLEHLDQVAADASMTRSCLLRQITSDFLNFVWGNGIQYRGSVLAFRTRPDEKL